MTVLSYSPSHTAPELLEKLTAGKARRRLLDTLVEAVRAEVGRAPHQHQLLIGPRGSGKTHVLTLLAHRLAKDLDLEKATLTLALAEEEVAAHPADLLAKILRRLEGRLASPEAQNLAGREAGLALCRSTLRDLRAERDDLAALDLCAETLDQAAARLGRLVVAVVENLDQLLYSGPGLSRRSTAPGQWALRRFLQESRGLLLLAAAPSTFGEVESVGAPFHGFFRTHFLGELEPREVVELIKQRLDLEVDLPVADPTRERRLRTLKADFETRVPRLRGLLALTGGLPRFAHLLFDLLVETDLESIVGSLERFLDSQTPYFQSRLDPRLIPEAELAILDALASASGPLVPTEIAERLRASSPNAVATFLKRLRQRGLVEAHKEGRRITRYDLTEPLFRLWRRFRRGRSEQERISLLAEFVAAMYERRELVAEKEALEAKAAACLRLRVIEAALLSLEATGSPGRAFSSNERASAWGGPVPANVRVLLDESSKQYEHGMVTLAYELFAEGVAVLRQQPGWEDRAKYLVRLSSLALMAGRIDESLSAAREAAELAAKRGAGTVLGEALWHRGLVLGLAMNQDVSSMLSQAEALFRQAGQDRNRAYVLLVQGELLGRSGEAEDALALLEESERILQAVGDHFGQAQTLEKESDVLVLLGRSRDALTRLQRARSLYAEVGSTLERARGFRGLADRHSRHGHDQQAMELLQQAEDLFQKAGDEPSRARALAGRGDLLSNVGRLEQALECFQEARDLFEVLGDDLERAKVLKGQWEVLARLGQYQEALVYCQQAEDLFQKSGDDLHKADSLAHKGDLLFRLGQNREAMELWQQADQLFQELGADSGRAHALASQGELLLALGMKQQALEHFQQAEQLSQEAGSTLGQANARAYRGQLAASEGNWVEGLALFVDSFRLSARVGSRHNMRLYASQVLHTLFTALRESMNELPRLVTLAASVFTEAAEREEVRSALTSGAVGALSILGAERFLTVLPHLEALLPAQVPDLLQPARLAAEVLEGKTSAELPAEPEEMRRVVREILGFVAANRREAEDGST